MDACIKYGWEKKEDPTDKAATVLKFPDSGWSLFTDTFPNSSCPLSFSMSNIVTYFVARTVKDSLPAGDFKSINKSAENLFKCGHIQMLQSVTVDGTVFVKANCLPEMKKDRIYVVKIALEKEKFDMLGAECGCPAGRGPHGSCKHIGALAYALADFVRFKKSPEYLTCTDKLQEWNQPRARKVEPLPACELGGRRRELVPSKMRARGSMAVFDPRPLHLRQPDVKAMESLRCDLLAISKPCGFLSLLIPSVEKISHDHTYSRSSVVSNENSDPATQEVVCPIDAEEVDCHTEVDVETQELLLILAEPTKTADSIIEELTLDEEKRQTLEEGTRSQSSNQVWFEACQKRITASKCGLILNQKKKTVALLQSVIYAKPFLYVPKAVKWGRENEEPARQKYIHFMESNGRKGLKVSQAGFVTHPQKGWLGATPDGWVSDPIFTPSCGILEIKCPYTKKNQSLDEALQDDNFYLRRVNGSIELDKEHNYYHQVQLQLYVTGDKAKWCDFCVYTLKFLHVVRIFPDPLWLHEMCPLLDEYFFQQILPELLCSKCKPSYYL